MTLATDDDEVKTSARTAIVAIVVFYAAFISLAAWIGFR